MWKHSVHVVCVATFLDSCISAAEPAVAALACLAASVICIYVFLIVVEYLHDRVVRRKVLTDLSPDELDEVLADTLRDEPLPLAPIDAINERRRQRQETRAQRKRGRRRDGRTEEPDETEADASKGGDGE